MGSLLKQLKKVQEGYDKVQKFLEQNLYNNSRPIEDFNLAETVSKKISEEKELRRKARNKRKSKR